jgi:TRAP-type C4-dicarboxylate transport system substrate-binding protein
MKSLQSMLASAALAGVLTLGTAGTAAAQDKITLTYATYLPQSFTWVQVDDWFMQEVTERTGGQVAFETFYGGSMLKATEVFPGLKAGAVDIATGGPIYNADMLPLSAGVIQPFVTEKADAAVAAFIELYQTNDALADEWRRNNMEMLYTMVATENAMWTDRPVATAEDLQGMRLRASGGVAQALELLGATTVAMGMGDGVQAFKNGAIDGFTSAPFDVSTLVGLHEIASHAGDTGRMGVYAAISLAFNAETWEGLPEDVRAVFLEVAEEAPAKFLEVTNRSVEQTVETLLATEGLTIVRSDAETDAAWREQAAEKVWTDWIASAEADGLPAGEVFAQFRDLVRKHEANSDYTPGFDLYQQRAQ